MNVRTILVPLDGSLVAEAALTPAVEFARQAGATLVLLRAAQAHALPTTDLIEVQVDRESSVARHRAYWAAVAG